jgi:hypothetical protein
MLENAFQLFVKHRTAFIAAVFVFTAAFACNLQSDEEWTRELEHVKLSRASNSGSLSNKTIFYFCPGGEYAMITQFSGFSGGGAGTLSMADEDIERGRWMVQSGNLLVQNEKGERREYGLGKGADENVLQLDGVGYLAERHRECQ